MSLPAADRAPRERTETRMLLVIIWGAAVVSTLLTAPGLSTDDAMRLVQVRDLLNGQDWFDPVQHRLAPPEGLRMHWSRLIDLPLAALIRGGELFLPAARAEQLATIVWPVALLLVFLAGVARLARELAGDAAARLALIFAALMAPVLQHFRPGAIDHHNAQLALLVWSLALAASPRRRDATLAGAMCALAIAIGQELAPAIAAVAGMVAVRWIVLGEEVKAATVAFALAFAAVTMALFVATVGPADYLLKACDAFSIVQVSAIAIGGFGLVLLTAVPLASPGRRFTGAAVLGALLAATVVLAFPDCLRDPYLQVDPRLAELWLNHVTEARSVLSMLHDLPHEVLPYYGLIAGGLAVGIHRCLRERGEARWTWIVAVAVLGVLTAMALWQVRTAAAANAIAVALVPAALVRAFEAPRGRAIFLGLGRAALALALLTNPLSLIVIGAGAARAFEAASGRERPVVIASGPGTCQRAADYAPLARLPQGAVVAFIDAGPFVLLETSHAAFAAPYHRNVTGNAVMFDIMLAPPVEAAQRLAALGVAYIAFCPGAPERYTYATAAPDGLAAALSRGEVPDVLERIMLDGTDLAVYRPRR
jgi:hypothetical protein